MEPDVLQPENEEGWCGNSANNAEKSAFEATLLMLPEGANFGVACHIPWSIGHTGARLE